MHSDRPLNRWIAYVFLGLSMALVGSYVALSRPLVAVMPVFLLAWLRFAIATLAMAHWVRPAPAERPMASATQRLLFLESFFGNFLFTICMLYGVSLTSAVSAGVIMACIPAVVALMSWLLLKEHIGPRVWAAVGCGAAGIGLLAWAKAAPPTDPASATPAHPWLGNLLVFAAVLCESIYAVVGKKLTGTLSPKRISALINLWGLALMTPLGIYAAWHFDFASVHSATWLLLVFYALAASVWTVWLWMSGLRHVPAAHAGVFTVMLPVSAALVGILVLGEPVSNLQMLAFAMALLGVVLATLPDGKVEHLQPVPPP